MIIKLNDIMSVPDRTYEEDIDLTFDSISVRGFDCAIVSASPFHLSLTNLNNDRCHIKGNMNMKLAVPCDRCLGDVIKDIEIDYDEVFNVSDAEDNHDLDDVSYIREYQLDLKLLIYEEVVLSLPMKILCKEDCLGICPVCGKNRNIELCDCNQSVPDPRMADALDMINDYFKEV